MRTPPRPQPSSIRAEDYIGDALIRVSNRIYGNWQHLGAALHTGRPQSGAFGAGGYEALFTDAHSTETFLRGMTGTSLLFARALAVSFPWEELRRVVDIGTAEGCVPVHLARCHPHLTVAGYDLPCVEPFFRRYVARQGLSDLLFHTGNFLTEPLPGADAMIMSRILYNWGLPTKRMLLEKAYAALPAGGSLIVCETLIDDARQNNSTPCSPACIC